ncbi:hypothetical protein [Streptomyces albiflavescens]|uniref:hypothetical protein n=1 Tax=Streptomyces albiflavescens TaxID=1623582 RepID=UPI00166899F4|nr:hypothetical protein [Streptomyces albiflavescens]
MKSALGRVVVGIGVTAALTATAACGGQDTDDKSSGSKKPAAKASPAAQEALKPLTEAQLTKAAITKADVKGYRVGDTPDDEIPEVSVPAKPATCQAIADMFLLGTEPNATARVSRSLTSLERTDGTLLRMGLLAHKEADAKKVVADLRTQSEKCNSYEHTDYQYTGVKPLKAPDFGDEAVSYTMTSDIDGDKIPVTYSVVRSGSTLVVFYAMNALGGKAPEVPAAVMEAQVTKVEKAA